MSDPEPTTYHTLVPFLWPMRTEDDRDLMSPFLSLSVFNLDAGQPQMYLYDRWSAPAMTAINPNAGDTLIWNPALLLWEPTPSETPILKQVKIYDDGTNVLEVKRFYSGLVKTGTGTGTMQPTGAHTRAGAVNLNYRVEIDLAGSWRDATFKWSDDGGATWDATGVPVATGSVANSKVLAPKLLNNAVYILFDIGTTGTFDLADRWDFVAIAADNQLYDLKVDTTNSRVDVGTTLRIANDANFRLEKLTATTPVIYFDAASYLVLNRSATLPSFTWSVYNTSLGESAQIEFGYLGGTQKALTLLAMPLRMSEVASAPGASVGSGYLYVKDVGGVSLPFYKDDGGVETNLVTGQHPLNTGDPHTQYILAAGDTMTGDLAMTGGRIIHAGTADAADTSFLALAGGGAVGNTRGAEVTVFGNEFASFALDGTLLMRAGNSTNGKIILQTGAGVEHLRIAASGAYSNLPTAVQTIAAATAILANGRVVQIQSTGNVTVTAAPTIANGVDGQIIEIVNIDSADTITVQDQGTLAASNLRLMTATVAIGPRDTLILRYNAAIADWVQISPLATVI